MRRILTRFGSAAALAAMLAFAAGCGDTASTGSQATTATTTKAKDDHDHDHDHDHGHGGPNGGALIEWGDGQLHAEFTVDHDGQEAVVYVLDKAAENPHPIDAKTLTLTLKLQPPVTVTLKADPQDGDPAGKSSRFIGKHAALGKVQEFAGTVSGVVDGKPYTGDFEEEAHDHKH